MESSASEGEDNVEVMEIDGDDGHSDHSDEEPNMKEEDLQGQKDNSASDDEKNVSVESKDADNKKIKPKAHGSGSKKYRYRLDKEAEDDGTEDENKLEEHSKQSRRLDYLLKQTEVFAHFMETGDAVEPSAVDKNSKKRGRAGRKGGSGHLRHRKTEQEEDEELVKAADDDEAGIDIKGIKKMTKARITFLESPPYIKNGQMRDFQIRGLNWLINLYENGINGILADEMGLGKTLQTISMLGYLKHYRGIDGHHLIIVPKSTLSNWIAELNRWCPSLKAECLIGNPDERHAIIQKLCHLKNWDVLVTSYEMVLIQKTFLRKISWKYLVIDEAHRIKNENSKLSEIVRIFQSKNRLLLTGTPLQNNLHELWALLNFMLPDVFNSAENFDAWFDTESCLGDNTIVKRLHTVLRPFLLRRIKAEVEKSLPPKKEFKIYVPMSPMQKEWYKKILMKDLDVVNKVGKLEKARLMNILMHLRKCAVHPYLFDGAEPGPPYTTDEHIITNSGKMVVLDKLLMKLQSEGSRVLLFSQFTRFMDIFEDYCFFRKIKYHRLDGNTAHEDRQIMINEFNSPGSPTFLFMLSTRAGGLGINLATADVVVMYDSDWNPQMDLQAMDRAHRIGQKKEVRVFRLVSEHTVEEKIVERAAIKLKLDKMVIQQGRMTDSKNALKVDDLVSMIRSGADHIFSLKDTGPIQDETIEEILLRSKAKASEFETKLEKVGTNEESLKNFTLDADTSLYNFEGENYRDKQKGLVLNGLAWIEPPKRERKRVSYRNQLQTYGEDSQDKDWTSQKGPPRPKQLITHDFQFYPPRLTELFDKEALYYQKSIMYKVKKNSDLDEGVIDREAIKQQKKIDNAKPLSESEITEKEELQQQGFGDWTRRDYNSFIKLLEKYGRDQIDIVAEQHPTKEASEVKEYFEVFRKRCHEIAGFGKTQQQIEKVEKKLKLRKFLRESLSRRIASLRAPFHQLQLPVSHIARHGSRFTIENDRFIILSLNQYGIDNPDAYSKMKKAIMSSHEFRFDWWMKSRSVVELQRRANVLLQALEKEFVSEMEEMEKEKSDKENRLALLKAEARGKRPIVVLSKLDPKRILTFSPSLNSSNSNNASLLFSTPTTASSKSSSSRKRPSSTATKSLSQSSSSPSSSGVKKQKRS